ncbi:transcription repressor [Rhynchospora pubera]|uniref:Transcription repressor n=1 Tax=Rhynchospora pubera TaxID=906938 RepID=A0AAV8AK18_9POAL|nr:transcription repressor [Rhynchospora pubera]KAJ4766712.1 transcription repressor [Rhynchospora pubera]KAJ4795607.1 transcription repressor [Rhynchospora pubera]KAJ4819433.1 transcription repressor [Rhynchospora pubera]
MASSRRRFVVRHPVVVDIGCSCRKPKLPSFLTNPLPKPKPKLSKILRNSPIFSSSTTTTTMTSTSSSSFYDTASPSFGYSAPESPIMKPKERKKKSKKGKQKAEEGVAVVKESSDPYVDFRDSMLQMIIEMEIYSWDDLRDLLHRFLALNSPCNHQYILRAFAEIWTEVFSPSASTPGRRW